MLKHFTIPGKRWIDETVPSYNWSQCLDPGGYPANTGHCPTIFLRRHTKATQGINEPFKVVISVVFLPFASVTKSFKTIGLKRFIINILSECVGGCVL